MTNKMPTPPIADKRPVTMSNHGIERTDNYTWLRADNWQEVMRDPSVVADDIRAYLEAENDYSEAYFCLLYTSPSPRDS